MKFIIVGLVLLVCALVTAEQEQLNDKNTRNEDNNGDIEGNEDDRTVQKESDESGSAVEVETNEGSGEIGSAGSGDEEDETLPQMPVSKPKKFSYFGMRGPFTITPMEPLVNRQKPFRRRCFFCFPRGRLGRIEMTPPGGPYLMNVFRPINGFGPMNGFGMRPYPGVGFPEPGPGFPAMGGFGGPGCGGPCCGGPCCGGPCSDGDSNQGPMMFQGVNEEEPKKAPTKLHDKPIKQLPNTGAALPPNKAMDQAPNKGTATSPNKVMDQSPDQTPNKVVSNEQIIKNIQRAEKQSDKSSKSKLNKE